MQKYKSIIEENMPKLMGKKSWKEIKVSFKGTIINVRKHINMYKRNSDCKDKEEGVSAL